MMKKRPAPAPVPPLTLGHTRYQAPHAARSHGSLPQGPHVVAVDVTTGAELWVARVFEPASDPALEADVQDVFLTSLAIDATGKRLLIDDERGRRFALDLSTHQVTAL